MTRVLFICGKARVRSPTAAQVFAERGYSTDYISLSDGDNVITIEKATDNSVLSVSKFIVKRMVASKESEGL